MFIYACKNSGVNYEQACTLLSDLNLPNPITRSNFQTGIDRLAKACTGYCVDFELLSNFCITCVKGPKEGDENYEEFMENNQPHCHKNTEAKSGAMEEEGALKIEDRTVGSNLHSVMLSDDQTDFVEYLNSTSI